MRQLLRCISLAILIGQGLHATAAEKYALLVGVSKYEHAQMNRTLLKYPEADAQAVGELLQKSGYTVVLLQGKQATQKAIEDALDKAKGEGTSEGVVLIGMFGHGVQYENDAYYCPYTTRLREVKDFKGKVVRDESGQIELEPDPASMISMRTILDALTVCGAESKVLLADCCRENPNAARGRAFGSNLQKEGLPSGMAALFACSENEQALESDEWGHGAFTKALLDECGAGGREITASTLSDALYRRVRVLVKDKTNGKQSQTVNGIVHGFVDLRMVPSTLSDEITNSIGMKLKLIPAGEFIMGSNASRGDLETAGFVLPDSFDNSDEQPAHSVRITKPFYMGIHEVTRGQFAGFVNDTGYRTEAEKDGKGGWGQDAVGYASVKPGYTWKDNGMLQTDSHPVINVSWNDAVEFIKWLSKKEGKQYRLPTEAEWEYCCRAGSGTHFSSGDSLASLKGFGNMLDTLPILGKYSNDTDQGFSFDDGFFHTSPVGHFKANKFGMYDMHGNVSEWCSDWYGKDYYAVSPLTDPGGPTTGSNRVNRGGGWFTSVCRSARRSKVVPSYRDDRLGFRPALSPSD